MEERIWRRKRRSEAEKAQEKRMTMWSSHWRRIGSEKKGCLLLLASSRVNQLPHAQLQRPQQQLWRFESSCLVADSPSSLSFLPLASHSPTTRSVVVVR